MNQLQYDYTAVNGAGDGDHPTLPITPPQDNESSTKHKSIFKVHSHNVNGLCDDMKLEFIPRMMKEKKLTPI
jgi:hypothetical protein